MYNYSMKTMNFPALISILTKWIRELQFIHFKKKIQA